MAIQSRKWIVTEHRQIVVEYGHPEGITEVGAARIAFSGDAPQYVTSDHTKRYSYAVHDETAPAE